MKKLFFIFIFIYFFGSCSNSNEVDTIVREFPIQETLDADIIEVPPVILSPANIFITGDKLLLFNPRQDTVFNMFKLPEVKHIKNLGIKGDGPNDFNNIDRRVFVPTDRGFKLFYQMQNTLKEVVIDRNELFVDNENSIRFAIDEIPVNGLLPLTDSLYTYWSGFNQDTEYTLLDISNNMSEPFSPYPDWGDSEPLDEDKMFTYVKNSVVNSDGSQFASFYGYFDRFRIYDNQGNILKDIQVDISSHENNINNDKGKKIHYYAYPKSVNNYIYVFYQNEKESGENVTELQVWDWNGSPIATYSLNENLSLFTISEEYRKIYAVSTSEENNENKIFTYDLPFF